MWACLLSLPKRGLLLLVQGYRLLLSPWLQPSCRYEPTCSSYALQAIERHGAAAGSYLTVHRVVRCNPFCEGGHDPVPEQAPRLFRHFVTGASDATGTLSSTPLDNQTSS